MGVAVEEGKGAVEVAATALCCCAVVVDWCGLDGEEASEAGAGARTNGDGSDEEEVGEEGVMVRGEEEVSWDEEEVGELEMGAGRDVTV